MTDTVAGLLRAATLRLKSAGIESPALDARLLLQAVLQCDHASLIAAPDRRLGAAYELSFDAMLLRRENHEPVSRILEEREFYGRAFHISPAVLDPRPDSETLITAGLELAKQRRFSRLADLGTGSGILGVTLLAELPLATGLLTDCSEAALAVAKANAQANGVAARARFHQADWLHGVEGRFDLIVSNPPYIPQDEIRSLAREVRDHDPELALAGGGDGLSCYRRIAAAAGAHLEAEGAVLVEIGAGQAADVTAIFLLHDFKFLGSWRDLGGHERALGFCR